TMRSRTTCRCRRKSSEVEDTKTRRMSRGMAVIEKQGNRFLPGVQPFDGTRSPCHFRASSPRSATWLVAFFYRVGYSTRPGWLLKSGQGQRAVVPRLGVAGTQPHRLLETGQGLREAVQLQKSDAQVVVCLGIVRLVPQRFSIAFLGPFELALPGQGNPQV